MENIDKLYNYFKNKRNTTISHVEDIPRKNFKPSVKPVLNNSPQKIENTIDYSFLQSNKPNIKPILSAKPDNLQPLIVIPEMPNFKQSLPENNNISYLNNKLYTPQMNYLTFNNPSKNKIQINYEKEQLNNNILLNKNIVQITPQPTNFIDTTKKNILTLNNNFSLNKNDIKNNKIDINLQQQQYLNENFLNNENKNTLTLNNNNNNVFYSKKIYDAIADDILKKNIYKNLENKQNSILLNTNYQSNNDLLKSSSNDILKKNTYKILENKQNDSIYTLNSSNLNEKQNKINFDNSSNNHFSENLFNQKQQQQSKNVVTIENSNNIDNILPYQLNKVQQINKNEIQQDFSLNKNYSPTLTLNTNNNTMLLEKYHVNEDKKEVNSNIILKENEKSKKNTYLIENNNTNYTPLNILNNNLKKNVIKKEIYNIFNNLEKNNFYFKILNPKTDSEKKNNLKIENDIITNVMQKILLNNPDKKLTINKNEVKNEVVNYIAKNLYVNHSKINNKNDNNKVNFEKELIPETIPIFDKFKQISMN